MEHCDKFDVRVKNQIEKFTKPAEATLMKKLKP